MAFNITRARQALNRGRRITHSTWGKSEYVYQDHGRLIDQDGEIKDEEAVLNRPAGYDIWRPESMNRTALDFTEATKIMGENPKDQRALVSSNVAQEIRELRQWYSIDEVAEHYKIPKTEVFLIEREKGQYSPRATQDL